MWGSPLWKLIVRLVGGFHEIGRIAMVVHDTGAYIAIDRVIWKKIGR